MMLEANLLCNLYNLYAVQCCATTSSETPFEFIWQKTYNTWTHGDSLEFITLMKKQ